MEYNTDRDQLIMSEYGRYIQKIAREVSKIPDRSERTRASYSVVELMNFFTPQFKNIEEYRHKLWDHLHIMCDYNLDIDAPYPAPRREERENAHPKPIPYPADRVRYRNYGRNIERLIAKALETDDMDKRNRLTALIANYMKIVLAQHDKDLATDEQVLIDLKKMSNGQLTLDKAYAIEQRNPNFFDTQMAPASNTGGYRQNNSFKKKKKNKFFFKKNRY